MGILGHQPPRRIHHVGLSYIREYLSDITDLAEEFGISVETVLSVKRTLEIERKNAIQVDNGDYVDEQVGGFGEILTRIASALENQTGSKDYL